LSLLFLPECFLIFLIYSQILLASVERLQAQHSPGAVVRKRPVSRSPEHHLPRREISDRTLI
jgi:hypothetical protein